ncbi:molybdate ABC transporter substrate-binding protein [Aureimonas leprariae]|uniref:Molybdate ABC transporter substrate-binding protein n=1 Tax=Plantimonas leprariae TaxID=2615207 RepID=A0A7V7TV56_9HYPH|nr:molybdate ABC transporter substrate-binding protein [Aureimonas leprariae]KAB0677557.1 molybdate ABC transporter substrate-binding protein [Aureimonas leprariae]
MTISERPAPTIKVLAAGSLRQPFTDIVAAFEAGTGIRIDAAFGPAGLLRERIESGEAFDLFASANMAHPERLHRLGLSGPAIPFTANSLCLIARAGLGMTAETMIEVMLRPDIRIGTSTPGADPSGDYALEFFRNVERERPGAGAVLAAKARALVGGRDSLPIPSDVPAAAWAIDGGEADVFVSYRTNGRLVEARPGLAVVVIPKRLDVAASYDLCLGRTAGHGAERLSKWLLSALGQDVLRRYGFADHR